MAAYTFSSTKSDYARKWANMIIRSDSRAAVNQAAARIIASKARYQAVEKLTGVPWWVIGAWHYRESANDFRGVLHNGEKIIGTGRKTKLVPAGRGPFSSWEDSAVDALKGRGFTPGSFVWTMERLLYESESYNGFGYRNKGVPSAYLWSKTNRYTAGKYVADGKWSATAVDQQVGVAALFRAIAAADATVYLTPVNVGTDADPVWWYSPADVEAMQRRLRDLGFAEVGMIDGKWGSRTTGALAAFQSYQLMTVTGKLNVDTIFRLLTASPRTVSPARATVTTATLAAQGDQVVKSAEGVQRTALAIGGSSLVAGVASQLGDAIGMLAPVRTLIADVPGWVWMAAVVGVAASLYFTARRGAAARVEGVRTGFDAGPA